MKKDTKIALIVISSSLFIGGVIALFYFHNQNKKKNNNENESTNDSESNETITNNTSTSTYKNNCTYTSTPFKTKSEGDNFRSWVNKTNPSYAKEINLDPSGSYNNCYIRKAYNKLGNTYNSWKGM